MAFSTKSIIFDGSNEYVTFGDNLDIDRLDTRTISFWFKTSEAGSIRIPFGKATNTNEYRGFTCDISASGSGAIYFGLVNDVGGGNYFWAHTSITGWNDGSWHHCAIVLDGSGTAAGMEIWVDGSNIPLVIDLDNLSSTSVSTAAFWMGARASDGGADFWAGSIDDWCLYDTNLNSTQIREIFNAGEPVDNEGLSTSGNIIAYYTFDDDTYDTVEDQVGSVDGTMTNMEAGDLQSDAPDPHTEVDRQNIPLFDVAGEGREGANEVYRTEGLGQGLCDSAAPTFAGLTNITAESPWSARLYFNSALDDTTTRDNIYYDVSWSYSSGQTFSTRRVEVGSTVLPGGWEGMGDPIACEMVVTDLLPERTYWMICRARDELGNRDENEVELSVTLPSPTTYLPVVTNIDPTAGTEISPTEVISFDVTDTEQTGAPAGFRRILVSAYFAGSGITEVVHDGDGFMGYYTAGSARTSISDGYHYSLRRGGGWPSSPRFTVYAIDKQGWENEG